MKLRCKKCSPGSWVEVPEFSQSVKAKLTELTIESPLHAVRFAMDTLKIRHLEAKFIVMHINKLYGHCNRCSFENLEDEYADCPKCGALNFNWRLAKEGGH